MKKNLLYHLTIYAVFFCLCGILYGDDFFKVKKSIVENAWKKVAFLYVTPAATLENLGYTSNIYFYREMEEPDWTADAGLDLLVSSFLGNRFILTVNEKPYYSFYAENVEQRALSNRLKTTVHTYLGRINLKYSYSSDYIKGRPTSEFGAFIRTLSSDHLASLDFGKYENLFLNLYFKINNIKYYEENYLGQYNLKQSMNREDLNAGIRLNKTIFSRTQLFLNYEYYEYKFAFQTLRNGSGQQVSMGIVFPEVGRISGALELGVKKFTPGNSLYRDYTKLFGSGEATIELFRRLKCEFQYLVNNFYSFWSIDQSFNERSLGVTLEYYIIRNIKIGFNHQWGMLSYEYLTDGKTIRQDDFYTTALYFGIRVFKKMGIGLEYRKYRADADAQGFSRSSDFIGGYLTHEF